MAIPKFEHILSRYLAAHIGSINNSDACAATQCHAGRLPLTTLLFLAKFCMYADRSPSVMALVASKDTTMPPLTSSNTCSIMGSPLPPLTSMCTSSIQANEPQCPSHSLNTCGTACRNNATNEDFDRLPHLLLAH